MSCHFLSLPEFLFLALFFCHQSFSLSSSLPRLIVSLLPLNTPRHDSLNESIMYGPGYQFDHSLPLYLCGGVELEARLDKWNSAVLLLIIMPRLSLTDTRDLSSAMQTYTYISLSSSVCVCICVPVCVCGHSLYGPVWRTRMASFLILHCWGLDVLFTLQPGTGKQFQIHTCTPAVDELTHTHTRTHTNLVSDLFEDRIPFTVTFFISYQEPQHYILMCGMWL